MSFFSFLMFTAKNKKIGRIQVFFVNEQKKINAELDFIFII